MERTILKNNCRCDLPSQGQVIQSSEVGKQKPIDTGEMKLSSSVQEAFGHLKRNHKLERVSVGIERWEKMSFGSQMLLNWLYMDCHLFGALSAAAPV